MTSHNKRNNFSKHQIELLRDDYTTNTLTVDRSSLKKQDENASENTGAVRASKSPEHKQIEEQVTKQQSANEQSVKEQTAEEQTSEDPDTESETGAEISEKESDFVLYEEEAGENVDHSLGEESEGTGSGSGGVPPKKHKGLQIFVTILLVLLVIGAAVGGFGYVFYLRPMQQYEKALELQAAGELDDARKIFVNLGDFQDAPDQIKETDLLIAQRYVQENNYTKALDLLAELEGYEGKGELHREDLLAKAQAEYEDHYYTLGQDNLKLYDFEAAKRNLALAQKYGGHAEAAATIALLEQSFDQVYEVSFTDNRDAKEMDRMTSYLWVHSVVTEGSTDLPLGMQEDLSIGEPNPDIFGQAYLNYNFYGFDGDKQYTFSYASSEMDAAKAAEGEDQRTVVTLAEFAGDYRSLVTEKIYDDNGELVAAPKIRRWNLVTDDLASENVRLGIRNRMWENLTTLGALSFPEESKPGNMTLPAFKTSTGATWKQLSLEERAQNLLDQEAKIEEIKKQREEADAKAKAQAEEQLARIKAQNPDLFAQDAEESIAENEDALASEDQENSQEAADQEADQSDQKATETMQSAEGEDAVTEDGSADKAGVTTEKSNDDKNTAGTTSADASASKDAKAVESKDSKATGQEEQNVESEAEADDEENEAEEEDPLTLKMKDLEAQTEAANAQMTSEYAVLINANTGEILYGKNSAEKMFPASMTKIMTLLVASEHVKDLSDHAIIDAEDINYSAEQGLTTVGFEAGEEVTVGDLLWGMILPSGAVSAQKLAEYVAGTQEEFVDLMNQKVAELGLTHTHFCNVHGNFDEEQYTTAQEMAVIINAAMQNPLARTVLLTHQYTTSTTAQHPTGITVSNRFLKNIEQKSLPGVVLGAKTGFVSRSMFCAASALISDNGTTYLCVTGKSDTSAHCINDHYTLYSMYVN